MARPDDVKTKRLLRALRRIQQTDTPMAPPSCLGIKFRLRHNRRCRGVRVRGDAFAEVLFYADNSHLPAFITSQLEAQKLTGKDSGKVPIALLLLFILVSLAPNPRKKTEAFPTLFSWYCPVTHKTYVIFAFLSVDMPGHVYSVEELLSYRSSQSCVQLAAIAEAHPELADIIRRNERDVAASNDGEKKTKDEDSSGSEELVYKGSADRRQTSGEREWKYRGRSGSEIAVREPVSAPTGLSAQQSEGFQRFYKAVVSPTHVRVTAGGRIVPNTRGASSPTTKRSKEKAATDGHDLHDRATQSPTTGPSMTGIGALPLHPVLPPLFQGFPPTIAPPQSPIPFMPMALGLNLHPGFPYMHPGFGSPPHLQAADGSDSALKETHNTKTAEERADKGADADKTAKVKISPPEQFDHSKPFLFNGHWVYPVSPNLQSSLSAPFMPVNVVTNAPFAMAAIPGTMMPHPAMGTNSMLSPAGYNPTQSPTSGFPGMTNSNPLPSGVFQTPTTTPISSIRPSEITKNQLQQLRGSMKYHENQLLYNRHQIDEKDMESKIKALRDQIQRFEGLLQSQLAHEEVYYPKTSKDKELKSPSCALSSENRSPSAVPADLGQSSSTPQDVPTHGTMRKKELTYARSGLGINSNQGIAAESSFAFDPMPTAGQYNDPIKRSGLPSDAALAPPFQPRGGPVYGEPHFSSFDAFGASGIHTEAHQAMEAWGNNYSGAFVNPRFPHTVGASYRQTSSTELESLGIPYLVGALPEGVSSGTASDTDYLYPRALTDDEIRARFLYWGKAPESVRRGLPKYDGKNFYPPSPVTKPAVADLQEADGRNVPLGAAEVDYGFNLPTSPGVILRSRSPRGGLAQIMTSSVLTEGPSVKRYQSFQSQINARSEDLLKAIEEAKAFEDPPTKSSGDGGTNEGSVDSNDRRSDKLGTKLWQTMLKKVSTSSAISSATAKGYLPQFTGHAAASLSPSMANAPSAPSRNGSPTKSDLSGGGALLTPIPEMRDENRPPTGASPLDENFRGLTVGSTKQCADRLSPPWE